MGDSASPDITQFLARQLATQDNQSSAIDLALVITDVQVETAITAASILTLAVADPDWSLLTSGFLDVDGDGFLKPVEVQYPEGSGSWWRLCMVDATTDTSSANLTLTFEDRIVARLREKSGAKTATRGAITRAGFIRGLAREVDLVFVCPSIDTKVPITSTHKAAAHAAKRTSKKAPGFAGGATVAGLSPSQLKVAQTLLDVVYSLNAGGTVALAILCTGFGETDMGANPDTFTPNSMGYYGVLQGASGTHNTPPYWPDPHDTAGMAHSFCTGGKGFEHGGAIATVKGGITDPGQIAGLVQVAMLASDPHWNDPHASGSAAYYGAFQGRAREILRAYGGPGAVSSSASADTGTYSFTRGTTDDPAEDSWSAMNRLASEVNEFLFSNGQTLYYMSGPDMAAQQPTLLLDRVANADRIAHLDFTWDNTAFQYRDTHTSKRHVSHRSRVAKANTPTEGHLDVLCEPDAYHAGEVVQLAGCGPADGRWIISDATRSQFQTFTSLTLTPPTSPLPEPPGATSSGSGSGSGSAGGASGKAPASAPQSAGGHGHVGRGSLLYALAEVAKTTYNLTVGQYGPGLGGQYPISATPVTAVHAPNSLHYSGRAADISGPEASMHAFASFVDRTYSKDILELIHNPGFAIKDGVRYDPGPGPFGAVWAGHTNHVHVGSDASASAPDASVGPHGGVVP